MPFIKADTKGDIKKRIESNPEFAKAYEIIDKEYNLIIQAVKERKELKISQEELAEKSGLKQQAISRIEKNEHNPSLKNFLRYLDGIGLALKIEKKENIF